MYRGQAKCVCRWMGVLIALLHWNLFVFTPVTVLAKPPSANRSLQSAALMSDDVLTVSEPAGLGGVRVVWAEGATNLQHLESGQIDRSLQTATAPAPGPRPVGLSARFIELGGYRLPARLITLEVDDETKIDQLLAGAQVESESLAADELALLPMRVPTQVGLDGNVVTYPDLAQPTTPKLPDHPLVLLREGRWRGRRVVVLALTTIYGEAGQPRRASKISVVLPGTRTFSWQTQLGRLPPFVLMQSGSPNRPTSADGANMTATVMPTNTQRYRITVAQVGIQELSGQRLAEIGIDLATLKPNRVQLWWQGQEVAVQWLGAADGQIDPAAALRFYAGSVGDRWNTHETFWLTVSDGVLTPGPKQIRVRSAGQAIAPVRTQALERGVWRKNQIYHSLLAGPDGDHWFAAQLTPDSQTRITLTQRLPLVSGAVSMTLLGSTYVMTRYTLTVRAEPTGGFAAAQATDAVDVVLNGVGDWQQPFTLQSNQPVASVQVASTSAGRTFLLDGVAWERPVSLDFGNAGGEFVGVAGRWMYQLSNVPALGLIYDVSDPLAPAIIGSQRTQAFVDGPESRSYLVSGPGTLFVPDIATQTQDSLDTLTIPTETLQIYIAPSAFMTALQPLLDLRATQQRSVAVVDVQSIYDAWNGGQVAPEAIRHYLQAMIQIAPQLQSVALVGDGNYDPLNYLQTGLKNYIPPYLARVDPDVGETACENCYGQLDEADVLTMPLADIAVGRLPVKSVEELAELVRKIVDYETSPSDSWQWRSGHVADNYQESNGVVDDAGNFPAYADVGAGLQPVQADVRRVYFDPYLAANRTDPWREANPLRAHERVLALFNEGATVMNYQGHGHETRWAFTASTMGSSVNYLLDAQDVKTLKNGPRLPVVLEMACLTGAFHKVINQGATIDELLLLAPAGGAIATWGSAGYGVAYQHEFLQAGFYAELWKSPGQATLGELTQAGLHQLYTGAGCCLDALQTYALLGDPMTRVRVTLPDRYFVPMLER